MANIRKTFNFRNGVQVDEDNLIVSPTGLVGIGTTVPTEALDVRGNLKVIGLATVTQINAPYAVLGLSTISSANIDIATVTGDFTAGNISISSGIITAVSGFVTYYGDGGGLYNIPTSQWVDIDVGLGFTSIYAAGYVGVATVDPRFAFQVGGNNDVGNFQNGVGINSIGDILATGNITATNFIGDGSLISNINASNISSGTLDGSILPINLNISGISTFNGNVFVSSGSSITAPEFYGYARQVSTVDYAYFGNTVEIENLGSGNGLILTNGTNLTLYGGNVDVGGNLNVSGISTFNSLSVGIITATTSSLGDSTANTLQIKNLRLGSSGSNTLDTTSGNLILSSSGGTTIINNALSVSGISTLSGEVTVDTGIIPDTTVGAYLGKSGREFSEAYIDTITIGVDAGKITTTSGNLILDSASGEVTALQNLYVTGNVTSNGVLNIGNNILPTVDLTSNVGNFAYRFNQAHFSYIQIGVGASNQINSTNSTDLLLDSASGTTFIDDDLKVSGIGTFTGELITNTGIVPGNSSVYLGSPSAKFSEAYVGNITIGVGNSTEISATSGNLILNASSGITTVATALNVGGTFRVYQSSILNALTVQNTSTFNGASNVFSGNLVVNGLTNVNNLNVGGQILNDGGIAIETATPYGPFQVGEENQFVTTIVATASTIGINTTNIIGIDTSGIIPGLEILESTNIIQSGTKVVSIGSSELTIDTASLNIEEVNNIILSFGTGYVNDRVFVVTSTKSVGIGTTNPTAKVDIRGDARVGIDTSVGVILTSANGTKYRLIVSNAGVLSTVLVP